MSLVTFWYLISDLCIWDHLSLISRDHEEETSEKNIMRKTLVLPVPKLVGQEWIKPNFFLNIKSFPVSSFVVRTIDLMPLKCKIKYTRANTAWKVSKYRVFLCPYFPLFSPYTGKYRPVKTPYLDTFRAVEVKGFYLYFQTSLLKTIMVLYWYI